MQNVGHSHRLLRLPALGAMLLAAACACYAARTDPNVSWKLRSRCWLPHAADAKTLGLFHLDDGDVDLQMRRFDKGLDLTIPDDADLDEDDGRKSAVDPAWAGEGSEPVVDASLGPQEARAAPPFRWEEQGRFRWALRLQGAGSVLCTPGYLELPTQRSFTVEAWFKPERLGGLLFCVVDKFRTRPALGLRLTADGGLRLECGDKPLGTLEQKLEVGRWRHIALVVQPGGATVLLEGAAAGEFAGKDLSVWLGRMDGTILIGNDVRRRSPYVGLVDELRVSAGARDPYPYRHAWTDPDRARELPQGPPFLRDAADVMLAVPMDEGVEPTTGGDNFKTAPYPEGKPPLLRPGVRGRAVVTGAGRPTPVYAFPAGVAAAVGTLEFWFSPHDWDNSKVSVEHLHMPREVAPLLALTCRAPGGSGPERTFVSLCLHVMGPREGKVMMPLAPGTWRHALLTWDHGRVHLYVDGELVTGFLAKLEVRNPPAGYEMSRLIFGQAHNWRRGGLQYRGVHTLVDELRVYGRPLTPPERVNAYARFFPGRDPVPLPFAYVNLEMNHPLKFVRAGVEMLSGERNRVASIGLRVRGPKDALVVDRDMPPVEDGRSFLSLTPVEVGYGTYQAELTYRDPDGEEVHRQTVEHDRPRPAWLGSRPGIHDGEVLPGWTPMEAEGASVRCWGREIEFDGAGWPRRIESQGRLLLMGPVQVTLADAHKEIALKPERDAPVLETVRKDLVVTRGAATGDGWRMDTKVTAEFDGMMKVETTLACEAPATIGRLRIDVPLDLAPDAFVGFWAGHSWFRGSADYRLLPRKQGVVFASNRTGRGHHESMRGKNSFIPYLALTDDVRGLVWFAENDRWWTKDWKQAAVEVVREGESVVLRLNIIHKPREVTGPMTIVFGLQPTPVRPMLENARSLAATLNFGWVDGFSVMDLKKDDSNHMNMMIAPDGLDWAAAARRSAEHRRHYGSGRGYAGPIMYINRQWVRMPPDATEFGGIFRQGGWRYVPQAQDCYLWYMNEWLRRGLIRGVYIDDTWILPSMNTRQGPAYQDVEGKSHVGYEFFGYREFLKRLRWVFHDNGMDPLIWVHMTQTHFVPYLAFCDVILEGEGRFLNPGHKGNFLRSWGLARLRYSSPARWGLATKWMNKIGNDVKPIVPMPHWFFRQRRAYRAGLMLNDIHMERQADLEAAGCYDDRAEFVGYWDPDNPVVPQTARCYASVYKLPDRVAVVLVNDSGKPLIATVRVDAAKLGLGPLAADTLLVEDCDSEDRPPGEDFLTLKPPNASALTDAPEDEELPDLTSEIEEDLSKTDEQRAADFFQDHNFRRRGDVVELKVRAFDYRLLVLRPAKE